MPRLIQPSFTSGELSPSLHARVDLAKYLSGTRSIENMFVHSHGGASNRPGTIHVCQALGPGRLIPFIFSVEQAYALEFTDNKIRVLKEGGIVYHSPRITQSIIETGVYKWTLSGSGVAEYYMELDAGGDPSVKEPTYVHQSGVSLPKLALGSLILEGCWGYGDNDSLGYDTIYVRMDGADDPDDHDDGVLVSAYHTATSLIDPAYKWTASGSGTDEYYLELDAGGDPSLEQPYSVYTDGVEDISAETLGALTAGQWGYGDNDSLGYSTIYIRLSDGVDPDTKEDGFLEANYIVEIDTPYAAADLREIKYVSSADVLYLTHPSYAPRSLTRTAHDAWTLDTLVFAASISAPENVTSVKIGHTGADRDIKYVITAVNGDGEESLASAETSETIGATWPAGGLIRVTWDKHVDAETYNVYKDSNGYFGWVGSIRSGAAATYTFTDDNVQPLSDDGPPASQTVFDAPDKYPGAVGIFEQRLIFGRSNLKPQSVWTSQSGAYNNFNTSSPLKDDDSIKVTIASRMINEIKHFMPLDKMMVFTSGAEWLMDNGANSDALTPTSVQFKVQSYRGATEAPPLVIGSTILFVQHGGKVVRDMGYALETDSYIGTELTVLANHLFRNNSIEEWAYQQDPDSIIWCIRDDGMLLAFTYLKDHEVWAWSRQVTAGAFESLCVIPGGHRDDMYFMTKRVINGQTVRHIEYQAERLPGEDIERAFFVDDGLSLDIPIAITGATQANPVVITAVAHGLSNGNYADVRAMEGMTDLNDNRYLVANKTDDTFELQSTQGVDIDGTGFDAYTEGGTIREAVNTVSGLEHLEGEDVAILADGSVIGGLTVSGGALELPERASIIHVGLPYSSELETLSLEFASEKGTAQGARKVVNTVVLRLENTRGAWVGPGDDRDMIEMKFRDTEDYNEATRMYTGDKKIVIPARYTYDGHVRIQQRDPLPQTILAIIPEVNAGE